MRPSRRRAGSIERLEDSLLVSGRNSRATVDHANDGPVPDRAGSDDHGLPIGMSRRILQQVCERALDLYEVCTYRRDHRINPNIEFRVRGLARQCRVDDLLDRAFR